MRKRGKMIRKGKKKERKKEWRMETIVQQIEIEVFDRQRDLERSSLLKSELICSTGSVNILL